MTNKKPAAKTAKKDPIAKKDPVREKLVNELRTLIPKLDKEGLAFLVEQSRIHIYNMQVDKINKLHEALTQAKPGAKTAGKTKTQKQTNAKNNALKIDPTGTGFYLRSSVGGTMFSKAEMVQLVKIANAPGTALESGTRLYSWFVRERGDVLSTHQIKDKSDKRLCELAGLIKKNFKIKK